MNMLDALEEARQRIERLQAENARLNEVSLYGAQAATLEAENKAARDYGAALECQRKQTNELRAVNQVLRTTIQELIDVFSSPVDFGGQFEAAVLIAARRALDDTAGGTLRPNDDPKLYAPAK